MSGVEVSGCAELDSKATTSAFARYNAVAGVFTHELTLLSKHHFKFSTCFVGYQDYWDVSQMIEVS